MKKITEIVREGIVRMKEQGLRIKDIAEFYGISNYSVCVALSRERRKPDPDYVRPKSFTFYYGGDRH